MSKTVTFSWTGVCH